MTVVDPAVRFAAAVIRLAAPALRAGAAPGTMTWVLIPAGRVRTCKRLQNGGRIVVLGEGMASLCLAEPKGVRRSGGPSEPTTYWARTARQ